jgi:hypothetical protein
MTECRVDESKIVDYLLNLNHPDGAAKAKFFLGGGFSRDNPSALADALKYHYKNNEPKEKYPDRFGGMRFVFEAPMRVPDGRKPNVISVWTIDDGEIVPRLITAYPGD